MGSRLNSYGAYLYNPSGCGELPAEIDFVDGDARLYKFIQGLTLTDYVHTATPSRFYGAHINAMSGNYGDQFWVELKDGTNYAFANGCPNQLIWQGNRSGSGLSFSYTAGLLTRIVSTSGRSVSITYNAKNQISQVTDNSGRSVTYTYTGNLLTQVNYPDTTTEKYTYDTNGNMLTIVDRRGTTTITNIYDANQRVQKQTLADSATYLFSYTLSGSTVISTDVTHPNLAVRHTTFDATGYPLSMTNAYGTPLAQTVTYVHGQDELITSRTDALSRTTAMTYNATGDLLTQTFLSGTANAVTYTYIYTTDFHDVASVTDPLSHTTSFGYDQNGCLNSVTDALGHSSTIICNGAGQPLSVADALSHTTTFGYDGSDLQFVSDALNRTTLYSTDSVGRTIAVQDPLRRLQRADYDTNSRLLHTIDALNQSTALTYDGNGNLTDVVDPNGGHTHYGYDTRNRRNARTDALGQEESWTYDGDANVVTYTDRKGQMTQYQYDALNRPSLITFSDRSTIMPTFDAGNRLTTIVDTVSGTINRSYDGLDRLTQEQTPQGTVNYTYDTASRRATMTPASQTQIVYTFDNADRLTNIVQGSQNVTISYDNANRRNSLTLPNGVVTSYGYDNANELTSLTYKTSTGTTLGTIGYTYDVAGQRLTRTSGFGTELLPTLNAGTNTFNLNNEQTVWNSFSAGYDLNGDPTSNAATSPATTYTFDVRHRLTSIMLGSTTLATFAYDAFGRRTAKAIGTTTTTFLYDGMNPVQETQGGATNAILTGLGIDERFARQESAGTRYFLTDALGSTVALIDGAQAVQQTYSYEPYGEVASTGSSDSPYQYAGRENDGTGLYYYRARYYSPSMKRFISEDPAGLFSGLNSYGYALGNPISFKDPLGLSAAVTINGNNISISIPISYIGPDVNPETTEMWNASIEVYWTGQFGKYDVTTKVTGDTGACGCMTNFITSAPGSARSHTAPWSGLGTWFNDSPNPTYMAAHEAGHLMGLADKYFESTMQPKPGADNDIMGSSLGLPTEEDILQIIESPYNTRCMK